MRLPSMQIFDTTRSSAIQTRRVPRIVVVAGYVSLIFVFLSYYVGLFSYFRLFYVVAAFCLAVTLIGPLYQQTVSWSALGCLLSVSALFLYFASSAAWSLYPGHTLMMVGLESINVMILAAVLAWTANASSRDVANLFRWLPRIVLLAYIYMLLRYGMIRGANAEESRAIAAIGSSGAMTAAMTIPFIMAAALRSSRLAIVDLLLAIAVLLLSESRTGYLLGALMLFLSIRAYGDLRYRTIARLASAAVLLLVGFAVSLAIPAVREAIGAVFKRIFLIVSIQSNPADAVQEVERLTMYLEGWNAFLAHPVLGIGYQSLAQLTLARDGNEISSHNLLLTLIAEAGWPAFVVFVGLMAAYFRRLKRGKLGNIAETDRDVVTAMRLSMIGLLVGSMFHQLIGFHLFYVLLGAAFGLGLRNNSSPRATALRIGRVVTA